MMIKSRIMLVLGAIFFLSMSTQAMVSPTFEKEKHFEKSSLTKKNEPIFHAVPEVSIQLPLNYMGLLEDMSLYLTTNVNWHQGDTYAHSVWVAKTIEKWFAENNALVDGIDDEKSKKIAVIAALLHDIGKAGDPKDMVFYDKKDHPRVGFEYLLGIRPYFSVSGERFDFGPYFEHIRATYQLDENDIKKIIILVGIHYAFGERILKQMSDSYAKYNMGLLSSDVEEQIKDNMNNSSRRFIQEIRDFASEVGYEKEVDLELIRLSILIGLADIHGSGYVEFDSIIMPGLENIAPSHYSDAERKSLFPIAYVSPYKSKQIDKKEVFARDWVVNVFKKETGGV